MKQSIRCIGFAIAIVILPLSDAIGQLTSLPISELTDSMRTHRKPALILITTKWCTYCRMQKAQLQKNKDFQNALTHFYFTEFDAEMQDAIAFAGNTYRFKSTGVSTGYHELAYALGSQQNRLAFPTWVLINESFEIIVKYPGVLKPSELDSLLGLLKIPSTRKK